MRRIPSWPRASGVWALVFALGLTVLAGANPPLPARAKYVNWTNDSTVGTETPQSVSPIIESTPATDPVSDGVGATVAQFRVDEGGNATYSIPIQVSPGVAGVVPKLSLNYNSRLSNGPMGPGWTISGTSQISRCRQTREDGDFLSGTTPIDGNPAPVNFTASDRFCLDGVRLLVTTGTYGANGSIYSPENDPFTQVTATVTTPAAGPDSFIVQRKDGTTNTYGNTAASPTARISAVLPSTSQTVYVSWNLARVQDSAGNYIDYVYANQPSGAMFPFSAVEFVLAQVNYTGHATTPTSLPYASVIFNYTTLSAPNVRLGYQAGIAFLQTQQLAGITVTDSTSPTTAILRYYQLTYDTSTIANHGSGSNVERLKQVKECRDNTVGAVCYPPTQFNWSTAQYTFDNSLGPQTQSTPNFSSLVGYKVADVDGDGRLDFVWAVDHDPLCSANVSAIYVGFLDRNASSGQINLNTTGQLPTCATIDLAGNDNAWYLADYDGDGRADLLIGGAAGSAWAVHLSTGRGSHVFSGTNALSTTITVPAGMNAAAILADVNGDGLPDLITPDIEPPVQIGTTPFDNLAYAGVSVRLMTRQIDGTFQLSAPYEVVLSFKPSDEICKISLSVTCTLGFFNTNYSAGSVIANDVDGDGRADLTFFIKQTPCSPCVDATDTGLAQLTFDPTLGKSEAAPALGGGTSTYYWMQFTAAGIETVSGASVQMMQEYTQQTPSNSPTLPSTLANMYVVDLTGDGLADLFYQDAADGSGMTYCVQVNTGYGYQNPICEALPGFTPGSTSPPLQLGDVDGNGRIDIVYPISGSASNFVSLVPTTSASGWAFDAAQQVPGHGIHSSANWYSVLADFDGDGAADFLSVYTALNSGNLYTSRATGSVYQPRDVVTGITNGHGATTTITYLPLTDTAVYQRDSQADLPALTSDVWGYGSPVFDVLGPMYVVSQVTSSAPVRNSPTATSTVYYRYSGALMQSGGRGFLGFHALWTFDANDEAATGQYVMSATGYGQDYPFTGTPEVTTTTVLNGAFTRGNATLNSCATNPDSSSCFVAVGAAPWPTLTGKLVSYDDTQPSCDGAGCTTVDTSVCTSTSSPADVVPETITSGLWAVPATPGPIFVQSYRTDDSQGDLVTGDQTAETTSYFCYDGAGASPGYGNLMYSRTITRDAANSIFAQKLLANHYTNDTGHWYLGRLTSSQVQFVRPSTGTIQRTTNFGYDPTTGILTSERIQMGGTADQDIRTVYTLDSFGNRTGAYQCSNDIATDDACTSTIGFVQQQTGTQVHRYAKTTYDLIGRYSTGSALPFYSVAGTGHLNEVTAMSITGRDEFGNATAQSSINGLTQSAEFGVMGRPYYAADSTGKTTTSTFRTCGSSLNQVGCSSDSMFKFREQTVGAGMPSTWTYFDVLGRAVLKVSQAFDTNPAGELFTAACTYYDSHNRPAYQSEPFFLNVAVNLSDGGAPTLSAGAASPCASASYATAMVHDILGRVTTTTNPDGGTVVKHYSGLTTQTTNPLGAIWTQVKDALGETIETQDPTNDATMGLVVTNTFDAAGDVLTIARDAGHGNIVSSATYDTLGRKSTQSDPDAGNLSYSYNAAGDVISQTDAKHQTVTESHDALGRRWQQQISTAADHNNITDTWTFDTATDGYGQIVSEVRTATTGTAFSRTFSYDGNGRSSGRTTSIGGSVYSEATAYDGYGRLMSQQDASGYTLTTNYTSHGFMANLTDSRVGPLYQMTAMTARGLVAMDERGGTPALQSTLTYNGATGRLNTICSGTSCGLQDLQYSFDLGGNLTQRERALHTLPTIETFNYDALNRLTHSQLIEEEGTTPGSPISTAQLTYDPLGNLCTKNGSNYTYAGLSGCAHVGIPGESPHAVTQVGAVTYAYDANGNQTTSSNSRTLSYNAFNQLATATATGAQTTFQYTPDGDRFLRVDGDQTVWPTDCRNDAEIDDRLFCSGFEGNSNTSGTLSTTYVGNVEILHTGSDTETRRYLGGVAIDYVRTGAPSETRYVFTDHLGSMDVVASASGGLLEAMSFDVHGNRRNPSTWQGSAPAPDSTTHGFTGHEHVDSLSFIHMNGRIYDPTIGRMLQADPMGDAGIQGLNRYSYVLNNPLALTDPTGYFSWGSFLRDIAAIGITVWTGGLALGADTFLEGIEIAAAGGFAAGVVQSGNLQGGLYGAFSAVLFYGIGNYFQNAGWGYDTGTSCSATLTSAGFTAKILSSGLAGGVMQSLEGGKFGSGFLSAGVTAGTSPTIESIGNTPGQAIAAAIVGGTASVIAGGKFGNGAVTGAFSYAFGSMTQRGSQSGPSDAQMAAAAYGDPNYYMAFEPPSLPQGLVDFAAGAGDSLVTMATFGFGDLAATRGILGIDTVDYDSGAYSGGQYSGYGWGTATLWAAGLNGGANSAFWSGYGAQGIAEGLGTTIGQTPVGSMLGAIEQGFGISLPSFIWDAASATFAGNAAGTANAVILYQNAASTWATVEAPILTARGIPIIFH